MRSKVGVQGRQKEGDGIYCSVTIGSQQSDHILIEYAVTGAGLESTERGRLNLHSDYGIIGSIPLHHGRLHVLIKYIPVDSSDCRCVVSSFECL